MATRPATGTAAASASSSSATSATSSAAAVRALLMTPLMTPAHEDFAAVRRQADALRDWFAREAGWMLQVEREGARLYKRPADLTDATRGLPGYDRRRYVLLCLACAVLERADPQITLHLLGRTAAGAGRRADARRARVHLHAATRSTSGASWWRCAARCWSSACCSGWPATRRRSCSAGGEQADALYDVQRRMLAGMLAAVRGPPPGPPKKRPATLDERLRALVDEHVADSDEGRRTALRHQLARRLLDDPVVYAETLDAGGPRLFRQPARRRWPPACARPPAWSPSSAPKAWRWSTKPASLTDVAMPAEGTDAHVTLLVAEHLADRAGSGRRMARRRGAGSRHARTRHRRLPARGQGALRPLLAQIGARARAPNASWRQPRSSGWKNCS